MPIPKNVNQNKILGIEILWKILHTVGHFIKLVVGEKHFQLEWQLSWYFESTKVQFYWILGKIWKNQENHCFLGISWCVEQMVLNYFQSLKYWKLSPVFALNYFSVSNDSLKMACLKLCYISNFCPLHHMICSSYQSSLAVVRNVNLNYLCNGPTKVLNPSLFDYIINTENSLVSRKSLISLLYVTSHLKTLTNIYTWEIFYNSLW